MTLFRALDLILDNIVCTSANCQIKAKKKSRRLCIFTYAHAHALHIQHIVTLADSFSLPFSRRLKLAQVVQPNKNISSSKK